MPDLNIGMQVEGMFKLQHLHRRLREVGNKDLQRELTTQIRDAGRPVLEDVKRAALAIPAKTSRTSSRKRRGLRRQLAAATQLSIRKDGVRFWVSSARMDPDKISLPRNMDKPKGWRHPVFGDRQTWVHQTGHPWFKSTIEHHAEDFRQACVDAIDRIAKELG